MPPQIDRVAEDEFSHHIAELEAQHEEVGLVRPDERVSEAFPEQFALYCEHFIDFFPRSPYHYKTSYEFGWPQKKKYNSDQPQLLIDSGDWKQRTSEVERHLDHEQWRLYHETLSLRCGKPTEFYWLGQNMPGKVSFHAIDADNKTRIGWYGEGTPLRPLMPVMQMPFEHFVKLKKIHDTFPNRIWCITSETLGLDIIKRHRLQPTDAIHERTKRGLARIGLGDTEVHPMPGRCKRRPFGEHYRTITADGVLTTWQHQLGYYLNPGPTPSFRQIASTLLNALEDQWRSWLSDQYNNRNRGVNVPAIVEQQREIARRVADWLDDDCPPVEIETFAVAECFPSETETAGHPRNTPSRSVTGPTLDLSSLRDGNWAKALEEIARNGLPADDSVGSVVFEMAKWLWWVELIHLQEEERHDRVLGLLNRFVVEKHNGFITRWNAGQHEDVLSQVSRCLDSAIVLKVPDRASSLKRFETIRAKRSTGAYHRMILLEPLILGEPEASSHTTSSSLLSTLFSVCGFEESLMRPLPSGLLSLIDEKRGRNRIKTYATRLVNLLYQATIENEFVRLDRRELCTMVLGYFDPTRFRKYNRILHKAEVIDTDSYRAHTKYTGYRLTANARRLLDEVQNRQPMP